MLLEGGLRRTPAGTPSIEDLAAAAPMPDNVQAVIANRLDLLDPADRAVLQAASVVGRQFWPGAVAFAANQPLSSAERALSRLEARDLVQELPSSHHGRPGGVPVPAHPRARRLLPADAPRGAGGPPPAHRGMAGERVRRPADRPRRGARAPPLGRPRDRPHAGPGPRPLRPRRPRRHAPRGPSRLRPARAGYRDGVGAACAQPQAARGSAASNCSPPSWRSSATATPSSPRAGCSRLARLADQLLDDGDPAGAGPGLHPAGYRGVEPRRPSRHRAAPGPGGAAVRVAAGQRRQGPRAARARPGAHVQLRARAGRGGGTGGRGDRRPAGPDRGTRQREDHAGGLPVHGRRPGRLRPDRRRPASTAGGTGWRAIAGPRRRRLRRRVGPDVVSARRRCSPSAWPSC